MLLVAEALRQPEVLELSGQLREGGIEGVVVGYQLTYTRCEIQSIPHEIGSKRVLWRYLSLPRRRPVAELLMSQCSDVVGSELAKPRYSAARKSSTLRGSVSALALLV